MKKVLLFTVMVLLAITLVSIPSGNLNQHKATSTTDQSAYILDIVFPVGECSGADKPKVDCATVNSVCNGQASMMQSLCEATTGEYLKCSVDASAYFASCMTNNGCPGFQ